MTTVSLRLDDEMCEAIGMNLTTFFTIYVKEAIKGEKKFVLNRSLYKI